MKLKERKVCAQRCACRKLRPHSSSGMPILVEDSTETVPSEYHEAFDPVRPKGLESGSQGCCGGEGLVAAHLRMIFHRLGVTSRRQLKDTSASTVIIRS